MRMKTNKKAFTLSELMIIIAIIGVLAVILIVTWAISAQDRAAINSYKTSMESVKTAAEMCRISNGLIVSGSQAGTDICSPSINSKYPTPSNKCGSAPYFCGYTDSQGRWHITTYSDSSCSSYWNCRGCRLDCWTEGCDEIGECN